MGQPDSCDPSQQISGEMNRSYVILFFKAERTENRQSHLSVYNGARITGCAMLVCDPLPQQRARLKAVEHNLTNIAIVINSTFMFLPTKDYLLFYFLIEMVLFFECFSFSG